MMKLNPYLNFDGQAEEAFNFYRSVFGGEFISFNRMDSIPGNEGLSDDEKNRVMHVALMVGNDMLMGSDTMPSMGHRFIAGNNTHVSINLDGEVAEAERLFTSLSEGGQVAMPLADSPWGSKFGMFTDKFGIPWMIDCTLPKV